MATLHIVPALALTGGRTRVRQSATWITLTQPRIHALLRHTPTAVSVSHISRLTQLASVSSREVSTVLVNGKKVNKIDLFTNLPNISPTQSHMMKIFRDSHTAHNIPGTVPALTSDILERRPRMTDPCSQVDTDTAPQRRPGLDPSLGPDHCQCRD